MKDKTVKDVVEEVLNEEGISKKDKVKLEDLKVAIVCDWLTNVGGAEKVLLEIHKLFPKAPIYTSKYNPKGIDWFRDADVRTGKLQVFPSSMRRFMGAFRQKYFEKLDLSGYDLVISVTGAEAKAVHVPKGVHISYCHVPTQYYYQLYDEYVKNPGFGILNPIVRVCFKTMVKPLREKDTASAKKVDYFVTISEYAKDLIKKYYDMDATVIHPPVEVDEFRDIKASRRLTVEKFHVDEAYVVTSRQVNWKRLDLAVKACMMTKRYLLVIGEGPEQKKLVKLAKGSKYIKFLPLMKKEDLAKYLSQAKGYLFPSLEPFGIAPVEAIAAGCPVIAYGEGGVLDYIIEGKNGILFFKQSAKELATAILEFEKMEFDREKLPKTVEKFATKRFDKEILEFVNEKVK